MKDNIKSQNLSTELSKVSAIDRAKVNGHKGGVLWFTGLSGSGKSSLAQELQLKLFNSGIQTYVLDGDNIRKGLNKDLGFESKDRSENIRRVAQTAKLFADAGFIVITSFISPYAKDRENAKKIIGDFYHEIYINSPLSVCKTRDPKGLYKKALTNKIKNFTGITDIYEEPKNANLIIDSNNNNISFNVKLLFDYTNLLRNF